VFVQYAEDVDDIFQRHGVHYHLFADDMQGHCSRQLDDVPEVSLGLKASTSTPGAAPNVYSSTPTRQSYCGFGPASQLRQLPSHNNTINVNQCVVKPVTVVRDLGVWLDAGLSMRSHVSRVAQTCFSYHLRRIRAVRRQLGRDVTARLVTALVLSRLDYCNAMLAGLPASTVVPFQRVLHAAARTVMDLKPRDRVTPALQELHLVASR